MQFNLFQSTAELQIVKAKETLEELSQLILSSPKQELINTEIKNLEKKIKDIDAKTKEGENAYKDEMKKLQLLEEYQKDEEKVKNSLNEIEDINKELRLVIIIIIFSLVLFYYLGNINNFIPNVVNCIFYWLGHFFT